MTDPAIVGTEFSNRVRAIPTRGLGLSVDVYSPELLELVACLTRRGLCPGYLEIFKTTATALERIRQQLPADLPLSYHGEGVWITQPESQDHPMFHAAIHEAAAHLTVLQSPWLNHECATKQMAGYSFGTYLPPLYTSVSAVVIAENIASVQQVLDHRCRRPDGSTPLFLLEMPPLTYFAAGTLPITRFFQLVTERVPCGLVLDMGHLWTVYRYTGACRTIPLARFVEAFLDEFPLERVVEIHIAGLAEHEATPAQESLTGVPDWLDAHAAPIPPVLFEMLEQVLGHKRLTALKGVALEVDTKRIGLIVDEFDEASQKFAPLIREAMGRGGVGISSPSHLPFSTWVPTAVSLSDRQHLFDDYGRYAQIVAGCVAPTGDQWDAIADDQEGLERYRTSYLPHEILTWGGAITEMFPETCLALCRRGLTTEKFVAFWFRTPRPITQPYDFFLLKIERFVEFVQEEAPELAASVELEAELLRAAYAEANEPATPVAERIG